MESIIYISNISIFYSYIKEDAINRQYHSMLVIKTVLFLLSIFVTGNLHNNILVKSTNQFLQCNITLCYIINTVLSSTDSIDTLSY